MAQLIDTRWFQDRLRDRQLSQRQLADRLQLDASAVSLMLRGKREIKGGEAAELANILGLPLNEVLSHAGVPVPRHRDETVPVVGLVDEKFEIHARKPGARVPLPLEMPDNVVAVRVEDPGSICYGWVYYYQARRSVDVDCVDRYCVIKMPEGHQLIRVLRRGFDIGVYNLVSVLHHSMENVRIASASPILWIKTS